MTTEMNDPLEKLVIQYGFTSEELKQIEQAIVQFVEASEEKRVEILNKLSEKQLEFLLAIMKNERLNRLVKNSDKRKEE